MKAFLLAAGLGTRLRPLTDCLPKCLVDIDGQPLLYHWLDLLEKENIKEVLINSHYLPDMVTDAVNKRINKINISVVYEEKLLGSAGTIFHNRNFVKDEDNFYLLYADNLTDISLNELYLNHDNSESIFTVYTYKTDVPQKKGIFQTDKNGKVLKFVEKPQEFIGNIANSGMGILSKDIFKFLSVETVDFSRDVLPKIIENVKIINSDYYIKDIGSMDDYYSALIEWKTLKR